MLLSITSTAESASDLGYLLHKNPARVQSFNLAFGQAHVYYSEASDARCTAHLLIAIDPITLVRGHGVKSDGLLQQYVNDRPYVASSFLSVAIAQVYASALAGRSKERPEAAAQALPLTARLTSVPSRGGEALLRRLFEPLGYELAVESHQLDETFPEWGVSAYYTVELSATIRLQELLSHIYVLIPVLDDDKHYWVGEDEVEKLIRHGGEWLGVHPEKELITRRYLKHFSRLTRDALARLVKDEAVDPDKDEQKHNDEEQAVERTISLNEQRLDAVHEAVRNCGASRVVDLGCGEGKLINVLLADRAIREILGMDVSMRELEKAKRKLELDRLPAMQRDRVKLIQGSLTYRDSRLSGFDAATLVEVIEHLDVPRLRALERVVFEHAKPTTVIVTTPNVEYNVHWETLPAGRMRHRDHRFEWTRAEFQQWATSLAQRNGYFVRFIPIGSVHPDTGPPTQMAVFNSQESTIQPIH